MTKKLLKFFLKNTIFFKKIKIAKFFSNIIAICKKMSEKGSLAKRAIKIQQSQITKLKEYKATLIDSAVTGKIKVS